MTAAALDYCFRYPFASELASTLRGPRLRLATCSGDQLHFFRGSLTQPRLTADLLRGLVTIVHSRFHTPPAMLHRILLAADPVITGSEDRLRFEAFSACCSTYARVDLMPEGLDGEISGRGTTNVDFNAPLRAALAKVRDRDAVELSVGTQEFELRRGAEAVVEKKVSLPLRWLKGFVEVQSYQARMTPMLAVTGLEAVRFLRALPRSNVKGISWVVPAGRGLRLSQREDRHGVAVGGVQRLRVLEDLARNARSLQVFAEAASQTSTWVLDCGAGRFHLVLSPEVWRGFSGEGQALSSLRSRSWSAALAAVQAELRWQSHVDPAAIARSHELKAATVQEALQVLGSRGLCGFDVAEQAYFHRVLPFDLKQIEAMQPRLQAARKLIDAGKVTITSSNAGDIEAIVSGSGVEHRVRIEGDSARCTCPWYAKHRNQRGPCKHVLAVQIMAEPGDVA